MKHIPVALLVALAGCATQNKTPSTTAAVSPSLKAFTVTSKAQPLSVIAPTGSISIVQQGAHLQWDADQNTGTNAVEGYNLYYGAVSRFYDDGTGPTLYPNIINVGNVTNIPVVGLAGGTTYYFAVTAVDQNAVESDFSDEVAYTTPLAMDVQFVFPQPVTNVTLQSSSDLRQWQDAGTIPTNGTWRVSPNPLVPFTIYRGKAMSAQ